MMKLTWKWMRPGCFIRASTRCLYTRSTHLSAAISLTRASFSWSESRRLQCSSDATMHPSTTMATSSRSTIQIPTSASWLTKLPQATMTSHTQLPTISVLILSERFSSWESKGRLMHPWMKSWRPSPKSQGRHSRTTSRCSSTSKASWLQVSSCSCST